jgi:hypothetical protein
MRESSSISDHKNLTKEGYFGATISCKRNQQRCEIAAEFLAMSCQEYSRTQMQILMWEAFSVMPWFVLQFLLRLSVAVIRGKETHWFKRKMVGLLVWARQQSSYTAIYVTEINMIKSKNKLVSRIFTYNHHSPAESQFHIPSHIDQNVMYLSIIRNSLYILTIPLS